MGCPKCGSENVEIVKEINEHTQGYGLGEGICGYICLGPIGLLCGLCGAGKSERNTRVYRMCKDCGAKFK